MLSHAEASYTSVPPAWSELPYIGSQPAWDQLNLDLIQDYLDGTDFADEDEVYLAHCLSDDSQQDWQSSPASISVDSSSEVDWDSHVERPLAIPISPQDISRVVPSSALAPSLLPVSPSACALRRRSVTKRNYRTMHLGTPPLDRRLPKRAKAAAIQLPVVVTPSPRPAAVDVVGPDYQSPAQAPEPGVGKARRRSSCVLSQQAQVDTLKVQLMELLEQQRQLAQVQKDVPTNPLDQHRKQSVLTFLHLRSSGSPSRSSLAECLTESFTLTLPGSPSGHGGKRHNSNSCTRSVVGLEAIAQDATTLWLLSESITRMVGHVSGNKLAEKVLLQYKVDLDNMLVVGAEAMCHWWLTTDGLLNSGFAAECAVDGMLHCCFDDQSRISSMEMTYDMLGFSQQLVQLGLLLQ